MRREGAVDGRPAGFSGVRDRAAGARRDPRRVENTSACPPGDDAGGDRREKLRVVDREVLVAEERALVQERGDERAPAERGPAAVRGEALDHDRAAVGAAERHRVGRLGGDVPRERGRLERARREAEHLAREAEVGRDDDGESVLARREVERRAERQVEQAERPQPALAAARPPPRPATTARTSGGTRSTSPRSWRASSRSREREVDRVPPHRTPRARADALRGREGHPEHVAREGDEAARRGVERLAALHWLTVNAKGPLSPLASARKPPRAAMPGPGIGGAGAIGTLR